ncbi:MAG: hypothetical protein ISQ14_14525 [Verrucomicrobiae bacterium]|jgi:hypothetical protein|nr:hypothetical protein [Verrucomicrobiae bacterium]
MIVNEQMEFGISAKPASRQTRRPQRKLPGARWWFEQMHRAVDQSTSWSGEDPSHIEQVDFAFPGGRN